MSMSLKISCDLPSPQPSHSCCSFRVPSVSSPTTCHGFRVASALSLHVGKTQLDDLGYHGLETSMFLIMNGNTMDDWIGYHG